MTFKIYINFKPSMHYIGDNVMNAKKIVGILIIITLFVMCCGISFASNTESLDDSSLYFGIDDDMDDIGDFELDDDSDLDDDEDWDDDSDLGDDEDWDDDSDLGDDEDWDDDSDLDDDEDWDDDSDLGDDEDWDDDSDLDDREFKIKYLSPLYLLKTTSAMAYTNSFTSESLDGQYASGADENQVDDELPQDVGDSAVNSEDIPKVVGKTISITEDFASSLKVQKTDNQNSNDGLSSGINKTTSKSIGLGNNSSTPAVAEDKNVTDSNQDVENTDQYDMGNNILLLLVTLLLAIILII